MLSRPHEQLPWLFGNSPFHKKYPYFLAVSVPATFSLVAWLVTFRYLKETHPNPTPIKQYLGFKPRASIDDASDPATDNLDSTPSPETGKDKPGPLRSVLTRRVVIAAANYAFISLIEIAFRSIQPVFFSTPIELGGLGLDPAKIGAVLSVFGILNGLFQVFFFAAISDRLGSKMTYILGVAMFVPCVVFYPLMSVSAQKYGLNLAVWVLVYAQVALSIGSGLSYGGLVIPSRKSFFIDDRQFLFYFFP